MTAVAAIGSFKENIEFSLLLGITDFNDARQACQSLDPPAELASFASLEEYTAILDIIDTVNDPIQFLWIGLQRPPDDTLNSFEMAAAFEFLDGTPNIITNEPFQFPWDVNEPSDSRTGQFCAAISVDFVFANAQTLDDHSCDVNNGDQGAVCKRYLSDSATQIAPDGSFQVTVVTLGSNARSFDDGIAACATLDPPGQLASFSNAAEFSLILDTIQLVPPLHIAWVGLKRGPDQDGTDAADFEFLDGTSNDFTRVGNQFPWADDEPNNGIDDQECASISYTLQVPNSLEDLQCGGQNAALSGAVCKQFLTNSPTSKPTPSPTDNPSSSPTATPTEESTTIPPASPVASPTITSGANPVDAPSNSPVQTLSPTNQAGVLLIDSVPSMLLYLTRSTFLVLLGLVALLVLKLQEKRRISLLLNEI